MMANSAYFHRRKSAGTLEEAIFTIGLKNLIAIVANHHHPESSEEYAVHAGVVRIASLLVHFKFPLILPFDRFPIAVPNRLEDPHSPQVMGEMEERYADYINQANNIAELMVGWS